jgi:hypothetical protein
MNSEGRVDKKNPIFFRCLHQLLRGDDDTNKIGIDNVLSENNHG